MTLMLLTESHGEIEAGFLSQFTSFVRLGEYAFTTRDFCGMAKCIADNPDMAMTVIDGYGLERFSRRLSDYLDEFALQMPESVRKYVLRHQGEAPVADQFDLNDDKISIPVQVGPEGRYIRIGNYEIPSLHFGRMAHYVVRGGFFGWTVEWPEFAKPTLESMKKSINTLYRELQKELSD